MIFGERYVVEDVDVEKPVINHSDRKISLYRGCVGHRK